MGWSALLSALVLLARSGEERRTSTTSWPAIEPRKNWPTTEWRQCAALRAPSAITVHRPSERRRQLSRAADHAGGGAVAEQQRHQDLSEVGEQAAEGE